MKRDGSAGYMAVVMACTAAAIGIIWCMSTGRAFGLLPMHMPRIPELTDDGTENELSQNEREDGSDEKVVFTEEELIGILLEKKNENFPVSDISLKLYEGEAVISGNMQKSTLQRMVAESGAELSAAARAALALLPENLEIQAAFSAATDGNSGLIKLETKQISVNGMEIPENVIGASVTGAAENMINGALCESGLFFTRAEIHDGEIVLTTDPLS